MTLALKFSAKNVRKPAGTVADPNWIAPAPNPGALVAPKIATPGQQVPGICEQRLNLAAHGVSVYSLINCDIDTANVTRARLRELKKH